MIHRISIHALLAESDTTKVAGLLALIYISIHALLAESDGSSAVFSGCCTGISIHALLAESDLLGRDDDMTQLEFLSTLSLRRATMGYPVSGQHYSISIHALLAESDRLSMSAAPLARRISIHALLAESDDTVSARDIPIEQFLSTLSLRRATCSMSHGTGL